MRYLWQALRKPHVARRPPATWLRCASSFWCRGRAGCNTCSCGGSGCRRRRLGVDRGRRRSTARHGRSGRCGKLGRKTRSTGRSSLRVIDALSLAPSLDQRHNRPSFVRSCRYVSRHTATFKHVFFVVELNVVLAQAAPMQQGALGLPRAGFASRAPATVPAPTPRLANLAVAAAVAAAAATAGVAVAPGMVRPQSATKRRRPLTTSRRCRQRQSSRSGVSLGRIRGACRVDCLTSSECRTSQRGSYLYMCLMCLL